MESLPIEISDEQLLEAFWQQSELEAAKRREQKEPSQKTSMRVFRMVLAEKTGDKEFESIPLETARIYHNKAVGIIQQQGQAEMEEMRKKAPVRSKRNPNWEWGDEND